MLQPPKTRILKFLDTQKLAVIATSDPTRLTPESALIAFVEDDQLCLYFQTGKHTRKATNLKGNPHVSFVVGLSLDDKITVQYEGTAEQLHEPADREACKQRFIAKNSPTTEAYFNLPTTLFFKVVPTWVGYSDYSDARPVVIELNEF